jgi:hypothetical protein
MKRDYAGSKAMNAMIIFVTIIAAMCLTVGCIMLFVALNDEYLPVSLGLYVALSSVPLFLLKGFLRGIESMVIASEMYIEQMEITEEKAKAETKTE